jgi:hypothetical protein
MFFCLYWFFFAFIPGCKYSPPRDFVGSPRVCLLFIQFNAWPTYGRCPQTFRVTFLVCVCDLFIPSNTWLTIMWSLPSDFQSHLVGVCVFCLFNWIHGKLKHGRCPQTFKATLVCVSFIMNDKAHNQRGLVLGRMWYFTLQIKTHRQINLERTGNSSHKSPPSMQVRLSLAVGCEKKRKKAS